MLGFMTPIELLRVIIGVTVINFLPGYVFSRSVFPNSDFALRLVSSIILSMVVTSIPPTILTFYVGFSWRLSLFLTLAATAIVSIYCLVRDKPRRPRFSNEYLLIFPLLLLAVFRYYFPYVTLNSPMPFGQDSIFHCRDIRNIVNNVAVTPSIYLQTFHFMMAANVVATGLSPPLAFMLVSPFMLVLIALEVYVFTRRMFKSLAGVLSCLTLILLTVQPFQTLADGSVPELFGYVVSMLGFIKLLDFFKDKSVKNLVYTGVLFAFSLYIHITSLLLLSALIPIVLILAIPLINKTILLRLRFKQILILAIPLIRFPPNVRDTRLVLGVFTIFIIAILLSLPASAMYISSIATSFSGVGSVLPLGTADKPSFPRDFENVLGKVFLYFGLASAIVLLFIARCKELLVVYSILISQVAVIEFSWVLVSFRVLRQLSIPLSILIGVFLYLSPIYVKQLLKLLSRRSVFFYLSPIITIVSKLAFKARIKLILKMLRLGILYFNIVLFIIVALLSISYVIEASNRLGNVSMWYSPKAIPSYQVFNDLPDGTILTDFSCGWLPYFVRNKVIIIPPEGHLKAYSIEDQVMFIKLREVFNNPNSTEAYSYLINYNISYIYLGGNPEHWVPPGYRYVEGETLNSSSFLKLIYSLNLGEQGVVTIYRVERV